MKLRFILLIFVGALSTYSATCQTQKVGKVQGNEIVVETQQVVKSFDDLTKNLTKTSYVYKVDGTAYDVWASSKCYYIMMQEKESGHWKRKKIAVKSQNSI